MVAEFVACIDGQSRVENASERARGIDPARLASLQADFAQRGETVAAWAERNGFNRHTVYKVFRGERRCLRGEQHRIAIALGLKDGPAGDNGNV